MKIISRHKHKKLILVYVTFSFGVFLSLDNNFEKTPNFLNVVRSNLLTYNKKVKLRNACYLSKWLLIAL